MIKAKEELKTQRELRGKLQDLKISPANSTSDREELPSRCEFKLEELESKCMVQAAVLAAANRRLRMQFKERKSIEESASILADIVESSEDAIIGKTMEGIITTWNASAERLYEYSADEAIGRPVSILNPPELPFEDRSVRERISRGERLINFETVRVKKDGSRLNVAITFSPIRDASGKITGVSSIHRDITRRKAADEELHEYARKLEDSNRALEDFTSIASHDLKEPLRKIQAFGGKLQEKFGKILNEEGVDYLNRMKHATMRMEEMIESLLNYSRVSTEKKSLATVDLRQIVQEVVTDLEAGIEQTGATIEIGDLPVVEADPMQMRQLFLNLIGNALKFHKEGETPKVQVYSTPGSCRKEIVVRDNGIGFDEEHLDWIFAPFQRLHGRSEYEGSGMGLAICRKIVERHGGSITAKSRPGKGATFIICLLAKDT